jgi:hypothetical protein
VVSRFIVWGTHYEDEHPVPVSEYTFATQAELDAFMAGVEASSGWMSYHDGATEQEAREAVGEEDQ